MSEFHGHKHSAKATSRTKFRNITGTHSRGQTTSNESAMRRNDTGKFAHGGKTCGYSTAGYKNGGAVPGLASGGRADRKARGGRVQAFEDGGKVKGKGNVNIAIVLPSKKDQPGGAPGMGAMPPPMPPMAPGAPPQAGRPPTPGGMPMPMPIPMPMGGGGGGPPRPPGQARGGVVRFARGGHVSGIASAANIKSWGSRTSENSYAGGGKVMGTGHKYPKYKYGAGSGEGRLEKLGSKG